MKPRGRYPRREISGLPSRAIPRPDPTGTRLPGRAISLLPALLLAACGPGDADRPAPPAGASDDALALPAVTPGYATGDPEAAIVIQEWADFQCPFCARHYTENHEAIDALVEEVGARFEYYELGTQGHPQALDATVAARCAGEQGAYREALDAIYVNQEAWSGSPDADSILRDLVMPAAADTAALDDCLTNQRVTVGRILNRNLRAAMAEGVSSTPTTIVEVNGARTALPGVTPVEAVRAALESLRGDAGAAEPDGAGAAEPAEGDAPVGAAAPPES